jgi:hypothetical protein
LRAPLPADAQRAVLRGKLPEEVISGLYGWFLVTVENASAQTWPGLSAWRTGRVALQARWRDVASGGVVLEAEPAPIAEDLRPGATLAVQVGSMIPRPGTYELEIGILQEGVGWFRDGAAVLRERVRAHLWEDVAPLRGR